MVNKDLKRIEDKVDSICLLILFIGVSLWGLFSILFVIMFASDLLNYRYLESLLSFVAFIGSFIFFIRTIRLFDIMVEKLK